MHLLIPFASTWAQDCMHALADLSLPYLSRVLARFSPTSFDAGDEHSLSPPHERALATVVGVHGADGCLPWAARQAALDGIDTAEQAWGLLTPVHCRVTANNVSLLDPAELALDAVSSRELLEAVRDLFESEGWLIAYAAPLRWYAAHESLRDLPCASIDRVIGRSVDVWMPPDPRLRVIRRLQSEAQMLLYNHPRNENREAHHALPVNSFWLSACGLRQREKPAPGLRVDDALRTPALAQDWAAWVEVWRALDAGPVQDLLAHSLRGEPATLTLCGERCAQRFDATEQAWWTRLLNGLRPLSVAPVLERL